jgi:hypothetical protein
LAGAESLGSLSTRMMSTSPCLKVCSIGYFYNPLVAESMQNFDVDGKSIRP